MKKFNIIFIVLVFILCLCFVGCKKEKDPTKQPEASQEQNPSEETQPVVPSKDTPTPVVNKYIVKFYDKDNKLISEVEVEEGKAATAPIPPTVEGYVFFEWDKDFSNVKSNLDVKATYARLNFTVEFLDDNGEVIETLSVGYGDTATPTVTVSKLGYIFTGWDKDLTNVKEDMQVSPLFEIEEYSITYYDGTKKLNLTPKSFTVLDFIDLPTISKEGYEFLGWYSEPNGTIKTVTITCETGDRTFYARWEEIEEEEKLTIPSDMKFTVSTVKKIPHSSNPNLMVYQPDLTTASITVPSTSVLKWTWESLDKSIATISAYSSISAVSSGYCLIKMTYVDDTSIVGYLVIHCTAEGIFGSTVEEANQKITYTVTFVDANDNEIEKQTVNAGEAAKMPNVPTIEGKTFIGWDKDIYNITADTTLKAQYIDGKPYFENKTVSILGDSISTYRGIIPDGWSYFYPYPTADLGDYNQTWWMVMANTLGMKLLRNNSWSGSCVSSGTGSSSCTLDSRLIELLDGDTRPDVIVINMGANDCASKYVSLETFDSSYKIMLDKIKALCPDSEIFLCLLPTSKMYDANQRSTYNAVISKYATEYSLNTIDLGQAYSDPTGYLVDSGHPNKTGMLLLGNACIKDMLASIDVTYNS